MSGVETVSPPVDLSQAFWTLEAAAPEALGQRALLCTVSGRRFAVPIECLRGIEPYQAVTPLPRGVAAWVDGVTNVRGTVVGVVDLGRFLGLGDAPPTAEASAVDLEDSTRASADRKLVLGGAGTRLVAFVVDDTRDVVDYPADALLDGSGVRGRVGQYVTGLVPVGGSAVPLLDFGRLLADEALARG